MPAAGHLSAKQLLELGDEDRRKPFLNQYWPEIMGVFFGIGSGCIMNWGTRRPVFSGIQKHVLLTALWVPFLQYAQNKRDAYYAERDAVFRHYIELHPEDFPEPKRKKIADIFEPWVPVR
ncbi:NADH-ubiquinone oxidoreductase subunit b14.5b (NDUFC2) domain-containing protein [Phthorimaea operculella]|nr:NADH-ubiquinone oxidoreductase subunit b14.5b (NDUFC2) domain-containing protein [Phthorimaea operculella]